MNVCKDDKINIYGGRKCIFRDRRDIHKPLENYGRLFSFHIYNPLARYDKT